MAGGPGTTTTGDVYAPGVDRRTGERGSATNSRSRKVRRITTAIIGALTFLTLVVVLLPSGGAGAALAAPDAPGGGRTGNVVTATIGAEGGVLTLTEGTDILAVVEVPPLAVTEPVTLVVERTFPPDDNHPPTPPWVAYSFVSFYLDVYQDGQLLDSFVFSRPVTVTTFVYDYYEEYPWRLFYWNDDTARWEQAVGTCEPPSTPRREPSWLHTPACRASAEFATLAAPFGVYLPLVLR